MCRVRSRERLRSLDRSRRFDESNDRFRSSGRRSSAFDTLLFGELREDADDDREVEYDFCRIKRLQRDEARKIFCQSFDSSFLIFMFLKEIYIKKNVTKQQWCMARLVLPDPQIEQVRFHLVYVST